MTHESSWEKKNTSRNRLYSALLTLNFLSANEKGTTAAERHWIIEKSSDLNQPVYFKDVSPSNGSQICYIGEGVLLLFPEEKKNYDTIKINKDSL